MTSLHFDIEMPLCYNILTLLSDIIYLILSLTYVMTSWFLDVFTLHFDGVML